VGGIRFSTSGTGDGKVAKPMNLDELIDAINVALEAGKWEAVLTMTPALYEAAITAGDMQLAVLVGDVQCIAQDALERPLEVLAVMQP
jgi:hypothetical protein